MSLLQFKSSEGVEKYAEAGGVHTIGSAISNDYILRGRGVRALHAQVRRNSQGQLLFRDFSKKESQLIQRQSSLQLGEWRLEPRSCAEMGPLFTRYFKEIMKEEASYDESLAMSLFQKKLFLGGELPLAVREILKTYLREISTDSPIERLLESPYVTDVLVENYSRIWVEKSGELKLTSLHFQDEANYRLYIENLLARNALSLSESRPYLSFMISNDLRAHLVGPPITQAEVYLSIRRLNPQIMTLQNLHDREMFSSSELSFLRTSLRERKNILVSGATGSGKTSLLRALLNEVQETQRIVIIEDTPELKLGRSGCAYLQWSEGFGLDLLVKESLRMRPDRIVIGELRAQEAYWLIHAMNTGHRGCMSSLHANSNHEAMRRLTQLILSGSSNLNEESAIQFLSVNLNILIHCEKLEDGSRQISEIARVIGREGRQVVLESI